MVAVFLVVLGVNTSSNASDEAGPRERFEKEPVALNVVFGLDPGKGNYDGVVGSPNDTWNLLDVGQTSIKKLRSRTGSETPVGLLVSENDGEWGIKDHAGVFHAYIYHNSRTVDLQATFTGLASGQYKIYVYAHGDAPDQNAKVELAVGSKICGSKSTLNDGSWKFRSKTFTEGVQYVSFEFAVMDSEPVKVISRRAGSTYSMFNAIQIVRLMK
jgi:hypothetical protein